LQLLEIAILAYMRILVNALIADDFVLCDLCALSGENCSILWQY